MVLDHELEGICITKIGKAAKRRKFTDLVGKTNLRSLTGKRGDKEQNKVEI